MPAGEEASFLMNRFIHSMIGPPILPRGLAWPGLDRRESIHISSEATGGTRGWPRCLRPGSMSGRKIILLAFALCVAVAVRRWRPSALPVQAQTPSLARQTAHGFQITFGVRNPTHGRVWSGGIRPPARIRSIQGWHFGVDDSIAPPDRWNITLEMIGGDVAAKGIVLDLVSPETQPVTVFTRYGDFTFTPADIPYGARYDVEIFRGDVTVERVPMPQIVTGPESEDDDPALLRTRAGDYWLAWVAYRTLRRQGYNYTGADQVMVAHGRNGRDWDAPVPLTPPGDHFRVALAEDGRGRIWCIYSEQKRMGTGNFDLYGRSFDGATWSAEQQLTSSSMPDIFHRTATARDGTVYLVWMGYRTGPKDAAPQSEILMRVLSGDRWSDEINLSQSEDDDWEPAVAVDSTGRAWITWDSYRSENGGAPTYDVLFRTYSKSGLGAVQTISATPFAEMRTSVAVDGRDRVWVAWEQGGVNWGKDTGYANPQHHIWLRPGGSRLYGPPDSRSALYRRPRLAVFEGGQWREPARPLETAWPDELRQNLYMSPRVAVDGNGHVWVLVRHQLIAQGRNGGQFFDIYATTFTGGAGEGRWLPLVLVPGGTGRQDTVLAAAPADDGIALAVVGDHRHFPVPLPINHDISTLLLSADGLRQTDPALRPFHPSAPGPFRITHPDESRQVAAVRKYRIQAGDRTYKIVRGDVHRHTEISMDGAIDGSLWDLYRYAIDAANLDYVAVTDHNYGAWLDTDEPESPNTDNEYQWWRTQKSADLFYAPGRFVPLYGYERSVNFPRGHRNILHVRRGVFSYRVPKLFISERPELIESDVRGLWDYLRSTRGIALPHSTGTNMGTNWRFHDDELEPVAELYSGDWGGFEAEGQPRAATKSAPGGGFSGRAPFVNGLIWNALGAGYKLGFIASSDHWSTHIAYANLLTPDSIVTRADLLDAFRNRRTYASTDNIVLDFTAGPTVQGGEIRAAQSPTFHIHVNATEPILRLEIIKNNRIVFSRGADPPPADPRVLDFSYRDNEGFSDTSVAPTDQIHDWSAPETGIRPRPAEKAAYYYVRVIQQFSPQFPEREGEIAWSSPIYVTQ